MSSIALRHGRAGALAARLLARAEDWRFAIGAIALAGLALRAGIALRDLDVVDRLFVPDDSYYTLTIARSLAAGEGPTVDGEVLTSGFQPLLAFLMVPIFAIMESADMPLRAALLLLSAADVGSAVVLGLLARRLAGSAAGLAAAALWALSPVAVGNALNGLETSLALFCQLALVAVWWHARDRDETWRFAAVGALAGLAMLARVDSAFLIAALAAIELGSRHWRRLAAAAAAGAIVVAPWWIYATLQFGSPVPESGAAVQELVSVHRDLHLERTEQLGWAAGTLLGTPFFDWGGARHALFDSALLSVLAWLSAAGLLIAFAWRVGRRAVPLATLGVHAVAVFGFYSLVVSALWFFRRYLAPAEALLTLIVALAVAWLWRRRRRLELAAPAGLAAVGLMAALGLGTSLSYLLADPPRSPDVELEGAKGYREAAADILGAAPAGAVIGSLQSGALRYYAPATVRVVNLDGVVDADAAVALKEDRLAAYARRRGVTHFADWPFNTRLFLARSGDPGLSPRRLRPLATARAQGPREAFSLFEIDWPRPG